MKKKSLKIRHPIDLVLSLAGLVVLAVLFVHWRHQNPGMGEAGVRAAVFSAAMFAVFGVRLVCAWMEEWRTVMACVPEKRIREPVRAGVLVRVALTCLIANALALLFVYALQFISGTHASFSQAAQIWGGLDSQHYIAIAQDWYLSEGVIDRLVQLVFLPGYPLVIRLFHLVISSWLQAAMTAASVCFAGAGVMLYLLARQEGDHDRAMRTLKYTLILPGAFFFAAPMSESLFFLLSISCFYFLRRGRMLPACLLGGMAAFTRSLGLMLLAPAAYEIITDTIAKRETPWTPAERRRQVLRYAALLLIPAGFGAYCGVCYAVSGNPFQFLIYQREHWSQSAGLFFNTAAYQTERIVSTAQAEDYHLMLGLWIPNVVCSLGALAVMAVGVRKLRPVYSLYFMAYYLLAIGTTWLLSAPRYLVACFPLSMALTELTENRRADDFFTILFTILYGLYAAFMAMRWQVW